MPVHLLLLLLLSVTPGCLAGEKKVIAVFPENIASYHPIPPQNKLRITALYDGTTIDIEPSGPSDVLASGQFEEFEIDAEHELDKENVSSKITVITGSNDIVVEIMSHRNNSVQTAVLVSTDELGQEYQVPPIPDTDPNLSAAYVSQAVTERTPFKLIIVSTEDNNIISLPKQESVKLDSNKVAQFWVSTDMVGGLVTGTKKFLAVFAHPCSVQFGCTCGVLYTPLQPHNSTKLTFIVPPVSSNGGPSDTFLLTPAQDTPVQITASLPGSHVENGAVLLQGSGLLMNLIPKEEFGSCFVVHTVADAAENRAVIVVPADSTDGVQVENSPDTVNWGDVPGTDSKYKYAMLPLSDNTTIIWHKYDLMAVYYLGKMVHGSDAWFGNPAARLSKHPDHRGCVLEPDEMELVNDEGTWQESIQACRNRDMDLVSLSDPILQNQIYNWTLGLNQTLTELWMGLRRSSFSGSWYWISDDPLIHIDWSQGSPGGPEQGECARISLRDAENPGWTHHKCCHMAKAVCYKPPKLLTI